MITVGDPNYGLKLAFQRHLLCTFECAKDSGLDLMMDVQGIINLMEQLHDMLYGGN